MSNNFVGARALFKQLGLGLGDVLHPSDIEIVAEFNPIRDVAGRLPTTDSTRSGEPRQVVPDLFLRVGNSALVIEAKFFTHPSPSSIADQLSLQRVAVESVLPHSDYRKCSFHFLALTVLPLGEHMNWPAGFSHMTWSEVISVLKPVVDTDRSVDAAYSLAALTDAVKRSTAEADTSSNERGRVPSIQQLLNMADTLLDSGYRFVGFRGGERALKVATVELMENRSHYKYSDCQPNNDWLPLHRILSHYLKLKTQAYPRSNDFYADRRD